MVVEKTWTTVTTVNVARKWVFQGRLCRAVQQAMWSLTYLFVEYSVKFDILRKYMIFFLEPTRNFTFVHMLNCQLCFKQPCWLHVMEFAKSVTPIRFWNFVSLMVDNVIKNLFFISCPHITSQFWYFDDLVGFREYFSFKRT